MLQLLLLLLLLLLLFIIIYYTYTYQLREVTMSLVMNILPNGLTEQHDSYQRDFCEILYLGPSLKLFDLIFLKKNVNITRLT